MSDFYKLIDKIVVPAKDIIDWGLWFENIGNRRIGYYENGIMWVSTVFIGLGGRGVLPDELFETMYFIGNESQGKIMSQTYEEAETVHQQMVDQILEIIAN